jgi:hypothetical protein
VQERREYWYSLMWNGWKGDDAVEDGYLERMKVNVWHCLGNNEVDLDIWREEVEVLEVLGEVGEVG